MSDRLKNDAETGWAARMRSMLDALDKPVAVAAPQGEWSNLDVGDLHGPPRGWVWIDDIPPDLSEESILAVLEQSRPPKAELGELGEDGMVYLEANGFGDGKTDE